MIPLFRDPTAPSTEDTGDGRLAVTYNGYVMNDPASPANDRVELVDVAVAPITNQVVETKQGKDGMEVFPAFKGGLSIRLSGFIHKPTLAALFDEVALMSRKFDPAILSRTAGSSSAANLGFMPLNFSVPTADLVNYPTGLVPSFYSVRPIEAVTFGRTKFDGYSVPFKIDLVARDPRRYLQTQTVVALAPGATVIDNTLAKYPSWPILSISMTDVPGQYGPSNFTIQSQAGYAGAPVITLVLTLTPHFDGAYVVDMERRRIFWNGQLHMFAYVSGNYFQLEAGTTHTITLSNVGFTDAYAIAWFRAFPL